MAPGATPLRLFLIEPAPGFGYCPASNLAGDKRVKEFGVYMLVLGVIVAVLLAVVFFIEHAGG